MTTASSNPSAIASVLQPYVDSQSLAGAVTVVANRDRVLSLDAVGFADVANRVPLKSDALFWIASITKPITGALVMMLVDEGKLTVNDPVEKHLPEFKSLWVAVEQDEQHMLLRKPKRPITIRDILSHTADMLFCSPIESKIDRLQMRDTAPVYAMCPLQGEPGEAYRYSNMGINTAGRIIEVVTGMAFEDFQDERLLKPLGMTETTFWPSEKQLTRLAGTHKPNAAKTGLEATNIKHLTTPYSLRTRAPVPAGGLFSTAADVTRFCQMVLRGGEFGGRQYLSQAAVAEMTRRHTAPSLPENYGLGWSIDGTAFGHGGALSTNMMINPALDLITIYLVQHEGFANNGDASLPAFKAAAAEAFGKR